MFDPLPHGRGTPAPTLGRRLNDRNHGGGVRRGMQSALGFVESGPASCSRIFPGLHTSRAMRAADAGISAIMQRIVGQIVVMNIVPDFFRGPIDERIDLH